MKAPVDRRQEVREDIRYNNELINQRLTWFGTLQGLLFAALAFSWPGTGYALSFIFCALGGGVALSIGLGTYGANLVIEKLERELDRLEGREATAEPVWRNRAKWWWWLMPGYFVPWMFLSAWAVVAVVRLTVGR
jgi:hypothetical protein